MRRIVTSTVLLLLFLVVLTFFLPICNAEELHISDFVGPYHVRYNDNVPFSDSGKGNSCLIAKITSEKEHYSFAVLLYSRPENNIRIIIEEDLGGAEKYLVENDNVSVSFGAASNYTTVEKNRRRIAGYEGTTKITQDKTGDTIRYGTFRLRSKTSCDDMTKGKLALVQISCRNYTKDEFDHVLDTFEIERYLAPNNGESYL